MDKRKEYVNPEDRIERLGELFVRAGLRDRHGITFEQYVRLVELGEWERVASLGRR